MISGVVDVTADGEGGGVRATVDVTADGEVVELSSGEDDVARIANDGLPPQHFHGYRLGRELGQGASGRVYVCSRKGCNGGFAVKTVDLRRMQLSANAERERTSLCREVEILKTLPPHPNIVQLLDAFEEGDWFLMVLELVGGGDLFTVLTTREPPRLLEREAAHVLRQLTEGLSFLHGQSVIHRDLKLENVLVASERREDSLVLYTVKITDFGLSKAVVVGVSEAKSLVGTRPYTAPEVVWGGTYDFSSDLWCLGVLLFVMLAGHFPFDSIPGQQDELDQIVQSVQASEAARSLLSGFLQLEPANRLGCVGIHSQPWVQEHAVGVATGSRERSNGRKALKRPCPPGPASSSRAAHRPTFYEKVAEAVAGAGGALSSTAPAPLLLLEEQQVAPEIIASQTPPNSQVPVKEEPCEAWRRSRAGIGEWLAEIYRDCGGSKEGSAASTSAAAELELETPANLQPDVMQLLLVVPDRFARTVLGRGGLQVKQIGSTLGAKVQLVEREGLSHHLVVVCGTYNQCSVLQELVQSRLAQARRAERETSRTVEVETLEDRESPVDQVEVALLVRAEAAGVVIGKQGFVLNQIRKRSGAKMQLLREQVKGQRPCILSGTLQSVLRAERHVFQLVRAVPVPHHAAALGTAPPLSLLLPAPGPPLASPAPTLPSPVPLLSPLPSP